MTRCRSCSAELPDTSRFCLSCGTAVANGSLTATVATVAIEAVKTPVSSSPRLSSSSLVDEGRFLPGTLLVDRYRIIGLLGRGGMGEVYRATDLMLGQQVALKFLPPAMAQDERALARFYSEVRIARQVSHPNVCRVYDIGQIEGQAFLSMEYVDGEDLASLLRRIGRLPEDKALDISRGLCAGLAAAHDRGVLHRDLKPANVMIDGRGKVLINDFGLAAIASDIRGADIRSGTPAYMSPEQLAGREVTQKSDIYALGLVLYEIFTGKPAFQAETLAEFVRLHAEAAPATPSSMVKDLDPAVERTILRCLDKDPRNRPSSALAVAGGLPGADPLAVALAAGETPSPELVAKSGETEGMAPKYGVMTLALIFLGLIGIAISASRSSLLDAANLELSPPLLAHKSKEILSSLGYAAKPADSGYSMDYVSEYLDWLGDKRNVAHPSELLERGQPSPLYFWYRQSPRPLVNLSFISQGRINWDDPAFVVSGMAAVRLDGQGRLLYLYGIPPQTDKTPEQGPADWSKLFQAAGLDITKFTPVTPEWSPLGPSDARAAWTGVFPAAPSIPLRVEAASWRTKPVYFFMAGPWTRATRMDLPPPTLKDRLQDFLNTILLGSLFIGGGLLARYNAKRERGDFRGAWRLGFFAFWVLFFRWAFAAHHVATATPEFNLFIIGLANAVLVGAIIWMLYLALEPFVRRRWPQTLISWTRILTGHWNDPRVGADVLIGVAVGVVWAFTFHTGRALQAIYGTSPGYRPEIYPLLGPGYFLAEVCSRVGNSLENALLLFFMFFTMRVVLRNQWLAAAAFILLFGVLEGHGTSVETGLSIFAYVLIVITLLRFGLVAFIVALATEAFLLRMAITLDFSHWYAGTSMATLAIVLGLGCYGFYISMNGRSIVSDEIWDR